MQVSFQPKGLVVPDMEGFVADVGDEYGPRNGLSYGWTCKMASNASRWERNHPRP